MRSLNLDQLRAFVEVVERGSFTAAARELNLTQPAVTHRSSPHSCIHPEHLNKAYTDECSRYELIVLQQRTTRVHLRWADRALFISGLDMLGGGDRTAWLRDAVGTPTRLDQQIPCEQRN
jgi:Bacterial regulatory helix-turn-helix protein, lysR family